MAPPFKVPAGVETELIDAAARQFKRTVPLAAEDLARVGEVLPENAVMLDELQGQMGAEPRHSPVQRGESTTPWKGYAVEDANGHPSWVEGAMDKIYGEDANGAEPNLRARKTGQAAWDNELQSESDWTSKDDEGVPGLKGRYSWGNQEDIPSVAGPLGAGALAASLLASKQANAETPDPNDAKWAKWASLPPEEKRRRALTLPPETMVEFAKAYTEWKSRQTMSREVKPPPPAPPVAQVQVGPKTHWLYDLPEEYVIDRAKGNWGVTPILERISRAVGATQTAIRENVLEPGMKRDVAEGMGPGEEYVTRAANQIFGGAEYLDQMDPVRKAQGINDFTELFQHPVVRTVVEASKLGGGPQMANKALSWGSSKLHDRTEDIDITRPTDQAAFAQQILEEGPKLPLYMFGGRLFKVADGAGVFANVAKVAAGAGNAGVANTVAMLPNLGPGGYGADEHGNREHTTAGGAFVGGALFGGGLHGVGAGFKGAVKAKDFIRQVIGMPREAMKELTSELFKRAGEFPVSDKVPFQKRDYRPATVFSQEVPERLNSFLKTNPSAPDSPSSFGMTAKGTTESVQAASAGSASGIESLKAKQSAAVPATDITPTAAVLGLNAQGQRVVRMVQWKAGDATHPSWDLPVETLADARRVLRDMDRHGVGLTVGDGAALDGPGRELFLLSGKTPAQRAAYTQRNWDVAMMEATDPAIHPETLPDLEHNGIVLIGPEGTVHPYRLNDPTLRVHAYEQRRLVQLTRLDGRKQWAYLKSTDTNGTSAFIPLDAEEGIINTPSHILSADEVKTDGWKFVQRGSKEMEEILAVTPAPQQRPMLLHSQPAGSLDELKATTRRAVLGDKDAQAVIKEWVKPAPSMRDFEAKQRLVNDFAVAHGVTPEVAHALMRDAAAAMKLKPPRAIIPRRAPPAGEGFGVEGRHSTLDQLQADNWQDSMPDLIDASRKNAVVEAADGEMGLKNKADFVPPEGEKSVFSKTKVRTQESAVADARRAVEMQKELRGKTKEELALPKNKAKAAFAKQLLADAEETLNESLEPSRGSERQTRSPESLAKGIATKKLNAEINRGRAAKEKGPEAPEARDARWENSNFEDFVKERGGMVTKPAPATGPMPLMGPVGERPAPFDFYKLTKEQQEAFTSQTEADLAHAKTAQQKGLGGSTSPGKPSAIQKALELGRQRQIPEEILKELLESRDVSASFETPPSPEVAQAVQPINPTAPGGVGEPPPPPPNAVSPAAPPSGSAPPNIPAGGLSSETQAAMKYLAQRNGLGSRAARALTHPSQDVGRRGALVANTALRLAGAASLGRGLEQQVQANLIRSMGKQRAIEFREAIHGAVTSADHGAIDALANDPKWNLGSLPEVQKVASDIRQYIQESQSVLADLGMIAPPDVSVPDDMIELYSRRFYLVKNFKPGTVAAKLQKDTVKMAALDKVIEKLGRDETAFIPPETVRKDAKAYAEWRKEQIDALMFGKGESPLAFTGTAGTSESANTALLHRLKLFEENPELRWALAESKDALLTLPRTVQTIARLRAQGEVFRDLAARADVNSPLNDGSIMAPSTPPPSVLRAPGNKANALDTTYVGTPRVWIQLPQSPTYGRMAGHWVRSDIYEAVKNVPNIGSTMPNWWQAIVRSFKQKAVLANPSSWWKSFFGNMQGHVLSGSFNIFAPDLHGMRGIRDAASHFKEFADAPMLDKTEGSRFMREARENLVVGGGLYATEMQRVNREMQALADHFRETEGLPLHRQVAGWVDKVNNGAADWIGQKFDATDQWNRYAAFLILRRRGVSAINAAQRVNASFPSYSAIPGWLSAYSRNTPLNPFATTTAQMIEKYALIPKRMTSGMAGESGAAFTTRMALNSAALGLAAFGANELRKLQTGASDEEMTLEKKKLAITTQGYRPSLLTLYKRQLNGEGELNTVFLDLGFMLEPIAWTKGNPHAALGSRVGWNLATSMVSGPITEDVLSDGANAFASSMGVESPALPSMQPPKVHAWDSGAAHFIKGRLADSTLPVPGLLGMVGAFGARAYDSYNQSQDSRATVFQSHGKLSPTETVFKGAGLPLVPGVLDAQLSYQLGQTAKYSKADIKAAGRGRVDLKGVDQEDALNAATQKQQDILKRNNQRQQDLERLKQLRSSH